MLSPQMLYDLEARMFEDVVSMAAQNMILEMRSTVYAHRVDVDDQIVPFSKTVQNKPTKFTIPARRRLAIPHAAAALVLALAAVWNSSIGLGVAALAFVALAALAWREGAPYSINVDYPPVTVEGEVKVRAKFFNTFPDNKVVYPDTLGSPVRIVQLDPPDVYYRHTDDLRGDADR